jgi:hypothetical protein
MFFTKVPSEVNDIATESTEIFSSAIDAYTKDASVPINESFLHSIKGLSSKTAYLRQKYPDSPEINNCLTYIDSYNHQVLNMFTKVNETILLKDYYGTEDFNQDANENLKTRGLMIKSCQT